MGISRLQSQCSMYVCMWYVGCCLLFVLSDTVINSPANWTIGRLAPLTLKSLNGGCLPPP